MESNRPSGSDEQEVTGPGILARPRGRVSRLVWRWAVVVVGMLIVAAAVIFGILPRLDAREVLKKETQDLNVFPVSVVQAKVANPVQELILPGNMQAFIDTPIYARTNGYLKRWHVDIGARVKTGQLLAEIDIPEVDAQFQQARANRATAEANHEIAEITAKRWQELLKTDSVSRQEADQYRSEMHAKKAALDAARYEVTRLEKLQSFKMLYAPFDGVITARNTDVGALIDAGSGGGPAKEIFHLASTDRLRVYVNVPQGYSREAVPGIKADLTLTEFPGRRFNGTLVRTAQSIDMASRTLLAEVDVDNSTGELLPGGYAEVHLKLQAAQQVLILPVNTLLFRPEGMLVAVVQKDGRAILTPVTLGRDFGTEVEVVSGLDGSEPVILNPSDSLISGTRVRVVTEAPAKDKS